MGGKIEIETFRKLETESGHYYVVIAGHTRVAGIREIIKRGIKFEDKPTVKVHDIHTSKEILAIQLAENTYSEPSLEERAIAIIETYRLGLLNKEWSNKTEFIEQNQKKFKFSKKIMSDAVEFANLPVEAQNFVFTNNIPYTVGIELGKMFPLIVRYEFDRVKDEDEAAKNVRKNLKNILIKLQSKRSIKESLVFLSGHINLMNDHFKPKEVVQQGMLDEWENGPDIQARIREKELINEYNTALRGLTGMPPKYFEQLFFLDSELSNTDHEEDIQFIRSLKAQYEKADIMKRRRNN